MRCPAPNCVAGQVTYSTRGTRRCPVCGGSGTVPDPMHEVAPGSVVFAPDDVAALLTVLETAEKDSHGVETEFCCTAEERAECEADRDEIHRIRALLAETT